MTKKDIYEKIIEDDGCSHRESIYCEECEIYKSDKCHDKIKFAKQWLADNAEPEIVTAEEPIAPAFGEYIPEPEKSETVTLIEKENSVYRFSKNNYSVVLTIYYDERNYTLKNNKYGDFIFCDTDNYNQNITVIELMLEATKFAKNELTKEV